MPIIDLRDSTVIAELKVFVERVNAKCLENNLHNLIILLWFEETNVLRLFEV